MYKLWILPITLLSLLFIPGVNALPYGAGTYGSCTYGNCSITITTSGTVNLTVTPTINGVYTVTSDSVSIETASSTGYSLYLNNSDTNTSLANGITLLNASTAAPSSPQLLAQNTWGYRVDGISGFGSGPTTALNSANSTTYTFAGVPASNLSGHLLKTTNVAADPPDTTMVWYGVKVNDSSPSGTYSDQVTYTVVTNI